MILKVREWLLLSIISCYLVFNYSFSEIRIFSIPLAEWCLVICLLTVTPRLIFKLIKNDWAIRIFCVWWLYALIRLVPGFIEYHWWALRDANEVIESLYLFLGIACVLKNPFFWDKLSKWFAILLIIIALYSLGIQFQSGLRWCSPQLVPMSLVKINLIHHLHETVPLIFSYARTPMFLFLGVISLIFLSSKCYNKFSKALIYVLAVFLLWYAIFYLQKRSQILQLLLCIVILLIYDLKSCVKLFLIWLCTVAIVIFMGLLKINLLGNQLLPITLKLFFAALLSCIGIKVHSNFYHTYNDKTYLTLSTYNKNIEKFCMNYRNKVMNVFESDASGKNSSKLSSQVKKNKINPEKKKVVPNKHEVTRNQNLVKGYSKQTVNAQANTFQASISGQSDGLQLRIKWWKTVLQHISSNNQYLLFGLGYGSTLIKYNGVYGVKIRAVHNFFFTKLGRLGVVGVVLYLSLQFYLLYRAFSLLKIFKTKNKQENYYQTLLFILFFLSVLLIGLVEPMLSNPDIAVVYYFIFGCILGKHEVLLRNN